MMWPKDFQKIEGIPKKSKGDRQKQMLSWNKYKMKRALALHRQQRAKGAQNGDSTSRSSTAAGSKQSTSLTSHWGGTTAPPLGMWDGKWCWQYYACIQKLLYILTGILPEICYTYYFVSICGQGLSGAYAYVLCSILWSRSLVASCSHVS